MKRHSYTSLLDDNALVYYNPFADVMKVEGPLLPARSDLFYRLEIPHRQSSFNYILCVTRVLTSLMYDQIVALSSRQLNTKTPVPLKRDDFHIWDIEQIIQMILSDTRLIHEAVALLWAAVYSVEWDSLDKFTLIEKLTLNHTERTGFTDFKPFYQRMKYILNRVGFDNLSRMASWALNPAFLYPLGEGTHTQDHLSIQINKEYSWQEKTNMYKEMLSTYPLSPMKRIETFFSAVEHSSDLFLSDLPPSQFFNKMSSRVPHLGDRRKGGWIDCNFDKSDCFLVRAKDEYHPESLRLACCCSVWKPLCTEWYQGRVEEEQLRKRSPQVWRQRSVKEKMWQAPTFVSTEKELRWRGDPSTGHCTLLLLEHVASQLLDGDGLDCPFYCDFSDVCVSDPNCTNRIFLEGIWRNTKPDGAKRWEKPPCIG